MTANTPASARMKEPPSDPAHSPKPLQKPRKHRWGEKNVVSEHKTERECANGCGIVKVTRHESEGGREVHWVEFWRDLDRIEGEGTPVCDGPANAPAYDARNYPL